jgi:hypothetical protein
MVAFSRTCRRFVRRRDKDTLAMDDLQIFRRAVTETAYREYGGCVNLAQKEDPSYGKKKALRRASVYRLIHGSHRLRIAR